MCIYICKKIYLQVGIYIACTRILRLYIYIIYYIYYIILYSYAVIPPKLLNIFAMSHNVTTKKLIILL